MSDKKEQNSKTKKLIDGLEVDDMDIVLKTLETIQEKGNKDLIKPLIELGVRRKEKEIQDAIQKIFFSLKISAAHPIILKELSTMPPCPFRKVLLSTLWEAKIDALDHVDVLVKVAIDGDLYEAIEVLTVLEESEGELNEEKILESLLLLKEFESKNLAIDPAKDAFIKSIKDKLELWNKGLS
jgi:hypothetical protein